MTETNDSIDRIQEEWSRLRPELDLEVIGIVGRVLRSAALVVKRSDEILAAHGLTRGEFDILTALRRADAPQSPGTLRTVSLATGPATTKRLRSLESRALVTRSANPADGRGALIALTVEGADLIDEVFPRQLAGERAMIAGVPEEARGRVVDALRAVLASVERG